VTRPFSDAAQLQSLLDVEAALAGAAADAGLIRSSSADHIRSAARPNQFDMAVLRLEAAHAGNLVIPLVRRLTSLVAAEHPESAGDVHRGATSQDILDTALVLQLRAAAAIVHEALSRAVSGAARIAREHATTTMVGRTWLQQASPVTLGLKAAGWLDMIGRCRERVARATESAMVVQLGGASGTLAALGEAGPRVAEAFARRLSLSVPEMPWHAARDRLADVACALGVTCGALGKIGRDLTLLAQTEVGEVFETPSADRGGSSSMPHKQNPVRAVRAIAAATRAPGLVATLLAAMPQEHERGAGGWQAEWDTWPPLVDTTIDAAAAMADALENVTVDAARMRANLDCDGGVAMAEALSTALLDRMGRAEAMALVTRVSGVARRARRPLADVATEDPEIARLLPREAITHALAPEHFLGQASLLIERVLRRWSV
jgi:3-carboxy-cis,cis-muconate cycloisomerase